MSLPTLRRSILPGVCAVVAVIGDRKWNWSRYEMPIFFDTGLYYFLYYVPAK
jgi:hypothetical protein